MDFREFFAIVECDKDILNPTSHEKLMLLADYCGVRDGSLVLDKGSGKGYMLTEWAKRWRIEGTGLEINAAFASAARERAEAESVSERLTFIEGDAKEFSSEPNSYDIATCIGAPFAIGTSDEAVDWMLRFLKPGGTLAVGNVYLKSTPMEEIASQETLSQFRPLIENHNALEERGLYVTGMISASEDDWDRYCSAGWRATNDWFTGNPDHQHRAEVSNAMDYACREYLAFQRQYVGWTMLVARATASK